MILLHYSGGSAGATCEGDSGGPYMVKDASDEKYYSFGMVSFGLTANQCGEESLSYSGFAYLNPDIMQWINTEMQP